MQLYMGSGSPSVRRRRGLSLVEILIAAAVLSLALVGFFAAIYNSRGSNQQNRELSLARDAAFQKLDEIRATPFDNIATVYGIGVINTITGNFLGSTFPVAALPQAQGTVLLDIVGPDDAMMTVRVFVTWNGMKDKPHPFLAAGGNVSFFETSVIISR